MSLPWNPTCPVQFESNKHEFLAIPSDDSCPHCRTSCLTAHSPPLTPLHRLCPSLKFVFVMMAALVHLWQWATIFGAWILRHQQLKKRWLESVGIKCLSKMENKLHANTCSTSCAESWSMKRLDKFSCNIYHIKFCYTWHWWKPGLRRDIIRYHFMASNEQSSLPPLIGYSSWKKNISVALINPFCCSTLLAKEEFRGTKRVNRLMAIAT